MITDISGRGVGMDVVRTNIHELGGQVHVESIAGRGTTFTLNVPLTLVTTRVLLIAVEDQIFGLPASGCHGVLWVFDQLEEHRVVNAKALHAGLSRIVAHPRCWLPKDAVNRRLARYTGEKD